jgi:hypothetical protein
MSKRQVLIVEVSKTEFILRGVDPDKILAQFQQTSDKKHLPPTQTEEKKFNSTGTGSGKVLNLGKLKPQDSQKETFIDRSGHRVQLKSRFKERLENKNGEYEENTDIPCDWHRLPFDTPPLGIPLRYEKREEISIWHCDGNFCSCECAYAFLNHDRNLPSGFRDCLYDESVSLLLKLHKRLCPGAPDLKEAEDWRVLKKNGGWKSYEEYRKSTSSHYYRTPNLKLVAIAVLYEQKVDPEH